MAQTSCNCIICSKEFDATELHSLALYKINTTNFKVCQACLDISDPEGDYKQVREIVDSYLNFANAKRDLIEAKIIVSDYLKDVVL